MLQHLFNYACLQVLVNKAAVLLQITIKNIFVQATLLF